MDEYNILRKKTHKKGGFATTAILVSLAIILVLVAIFVFLLGKINQKTESTNNKSDNSSEVLKDEEKCQGKDTEECTTIVKCQSKERLFNDNLKDIKDAAVSYFTNERLPDTIGEKKILSLAKMQEEKLVLDIKDSNDKSCDSSKSYVEVTKEKNEYVMKISLSCSDMEDYIIIHLGCYDYCKDKICEKQDDEGVTEFEYEYKKVTSCTMSEWSAWSEWQTKQEKTSNYKKEDTKVVTTTKTYTDTIDATKTGGDYNCDKYGSDYKLEGTYCVKRTTTTEVVDATPSKYSYHCNNYPGYTLNGTKCEKTITTTDTKDAVASAPTYSCPGGYTLSGTTCYRMVNKTSTQNANVSCDAGYTLSNNQCVKTVQNRENINATRDLLTYSCPNGYKSDDITYTVKNGDTLTSIANAYHISVDAIKAVNNISSVSVGQRLSLPAKYQTVCYRMVDKTDTKAATESCPSGYSPVGSRCAKTTYKKETTSASASYRTESYTYTSNCSVPHATTTLVYECNNNGCGMVPQTSYEYTWETCEEHGTTEVFDGYSCSYGYTLSGSTCYREVPKITYASKVSTCPDGYSKNGATCTKTYQEKETVNANQNAATYSCPSGYTKENTTCYRIVNSTDTRNVIRTCASGYTLSGTTCTKTYQEKETINATKNATVYSCESGYTLNGTKCQKTTSTFDVKDATRVNGGYTCKSGFVLNGTKCERLVTNLDTQNATKTTVKYSCKSGYKLSGTKCSKEVTKEVKTTYYRYATRTCTGGSTDIKWSKDKNDQSLLNSGYTLTGNKRKVETKTTTTTEKEILDK